MEFFFRDKVLPVREHRNFTANQNLRFLFLFFRNSARCRRRKLTFAS